MPGKHLTPSQKTDALTLRAAGHTVTVISDRTGISVSTLKRLFNDYDVRKGKLKKDAVEEATNALLNDTNAIENIKREVSAFILDDLALAKRLRTAMAEAADKLVAADTTQAVQVMRAISSGAVALKSTSETVRKSLGIDKDNEIDDDLPELKIQIMTEGEIEAIKQRARERVVGVSDGLDGVLPDDNDVVAYEDMDVERETSDAVE